LGETRTWKHGTYAPEFVASEIEVVPLTMPLRQGVFDFPDLPRKNFHGLPGMLADSLPDRFGNSLINRWLAEQNRSLAAAHAGAHAPMAALTDCTAAY
jgi:serine/threonine protein kinase HipA of HipAB toxin-antitoxin module